MANKEILIIYRCGETNVRFGRLSEANLGATEFDKMRTVKFRYFQLFVLLTYTEDAFVSFYPTFISVEPRPNIANKITKQPIVNKGS